MTELTLTNINAKHLFATPLIVSEMPAAVAAEINSRLIAFLHAKEKEGGGAKASNDGGWQSNDQILQWGGDDVQTIVAALRQMVDHITMRLTKDVFVREPLPWKINGWANINRKGHANLPHIHPGAYWSAVYYVKTDAPNDISKDSSKGGAFKMFDPRGGLPLMYAPTLRMGMEGYTAAGNFELHYPKSGECLIFPAWLSHAVTPYLGDDERISLAFNFSI